MGIVQCEKHGPRAGNLCCDHVLKAIYNKGPSVIYEEIKCGLNGDGKYILVHLICLDCIEKYCLIGEAFVDGKIWDNEQKLPDICPVCSVCLKEYEN